MHLWDWQFTCLEHSASLNNSDLAEVLNKIVEGHNYLCDENEHTPKQSSINLSKFLVDIHPIDSLITCMSLSLSLSWGSTYILALRSRCGRRRCKFQSPE